MEALAAGKAVSEIDFDIIFTSRLVRSKQTALIAMTQVSFLEAYIRKVFKSAELSVRIVKSCLLHFYDVKIKLFQILFFHFAINILIFLNISEFSVTLLSLICAFLCYFF